MTIKYVCPKCGSEDIIKKGFINGKQRFQCKKCKKTFFGTKKNRKKATKPKAEAEAGKITNVFDVYKKQFGLI